MRLTISFLPLGEDPISLPLHYNYLLQAFIYNHISSRMSSFLHSRGYIYGKRKFKLFCFSRLGGKFKLLPDRGEIRFTDGVSLDISSPARDFIQEFGETLAREPEVEIAGNLLVVNSIEVHFRPSVGPTADVRMVSPVTIYSTLYSAGGVKKTYYYSPFEEEFCSLTRENLVKKYAVFYGSRPCCDDFEIKPLKVDKRCEKIVKYKGTVVKGWMGQYRLSGSPELIALAYDAGLGAKNSQGFGMFEMVG